MGAGDAALCLALTGSRFLQHCRDPFARSNGPPAAPVYPGDTLGARSKVTGLKQVSIGQAGIGHVRTHGFKDDGTPMLEHASGHGA